MKTKPTLSTTSNHKRAKPTSPLIQYGVMICLACIIVAAITELYLALQPTTTPLGDPYYLDKILAPERAFVPWFATMAVLAIASVLGIVQLWLIHKPKR